MSDFSKSIADFAHNAISDFVNENIDRIKGAAASIIDPATGKHADVFVHRAGDRIIMTTQGSPEFARELEKRLGLEENAVMSRESPVVSTPKLYFAHASENKGVAKPLANRMVANGIDVWFDEWEIGTGDSLRRKMEGGLSNCTHFLVLLTPESVGKPWVETEIDAGFVQNVDGQSRFMGIRVGIGIEKLSPFLRTVRCPEIDLNNNDQVEALITEIHGISKKPALGPAPKHVAHSPVGLERWPQSAIAVAKFLVESSKNGLGLLDPQTIPELVLACHRTFARRCEDGGS